MAADLSSNLPNGAPAAADRKKSRENERRRRQKQKKNKAPSNAGAAADAGEKDKSDSKPPVRLAPPGIPRAWAGFISGVRARLSRGL